MNCLVRPSCAAWTAVPSGDSVTCTTTTSAPDTMTLENMEDSVYGFKIGKLDSRIGVLEDIDGTVYVSPNKAMKFQEGKDHCNKIPGFNLIMLKTRQHFSLLPFFTKVVDKGFINLKRASGRLQWGDGSFMTEQEVSEHVEGGTSTLLYQIRDKKIKTLVEDHDDRLFMCQGKTLGTW